MGWRERFLGRGRQATGKQVEQALRDLAQHDTKAGRDRLYQALLEGKLLLATPGEAERQAAAGLTVGVPSQGPIELRFLATEDPDGNPAILAFTSAEAVNLFRPVGCDTTELEARDVARLATAHGRTLLLNPRGPVGGFLRRDEVLALAEGRTPQPMGSGVEATRIEAGVAFEVRPPRAPDRWLSPLRAAAAAQEGIAAAYLIEAAIGGAPPHLVVVLRLEGGADPDVVIPPLARSLESVVPEGEVLDFLPGAEDSAIVQEAKRLGVTLVERSP